MDKKIKKVAHQVKKDSKKEEKSLGSLLKMDKKQDKKMASCGSVKKGK